MMVGGSQARSRVGGRCHSRWAGQVDTKLTAHIRGTDGGSLASGGAAASLETRLTARHGDSGLGRFVLQRKV